MDVQAGFFGAESLFFALRLPREVMWLDPERPEELARCRWDLLTLTQGGCASLESIRELFCTCETLLVPGDCPPELVRRVAAETVVTFGMSPRDSLTFSSLEEPVLCVQRRLPRPDGGTVEPQELPLPPLPGPTEELLPLLGARLLQMPLTSQLIPW